MVIIIVIYVSIHNYAYSYVVILLLVQSKTLDGPIEETVATNAQFFFFNSSMIFL